MFKVLLPLGLENAPAIFHEALSNILHRNNFDELRLNYIDDIFIFSRTRYDHIKHVYKNY